MSKEKAAEVADDLPMVWSNGQWGEGMSKDKAAAVADDLGFLDAEGDSGASDQVLADLDALEAEARAADLPPVSDEEVAAASAAADLEAESYAMGARMAVGFVSQLVAMKWPGVTVPAEGQAEIADKLAPVMAKHGGGLPDWLLPYQEELALGMAVAGVAFGVAMQARAVRAAEAAAQAADTPEKQQKPAAATKAAPPVGGTVEVPDELAFLSAAKG